MPPLRPHDDVCDAVRALIPPSAAPVLLLGVTPEFTTLGRAVVAVDWSANAVSNIWPGNGATRRVIRANWLATPCAAAAFSAAIGDGSLSALAFPDGYSRLCAELTRVLEPGGRVAIRLYATPEAGETMAAVRASALSGGVANVQALKWRLAHAIATESGRPNVAVQSILAAFDILFPDRRLLAHATGWSRDEVSRLDAYREMPDVFSFPAASCVVRLVSAFFDGVTLIESGAYPLAERCPLLVMERRA